MTETELTLLREGAEAALKRAQEAMQDDNSETFLVHLDQALDHLKSLNEAQAQ